jgi:hypothetical protein
MSNKSATMAAHDVATQMDPKSLVETLQARYQTKARCLLYLLAYNGYGLAHCTEGARDIKRQYEIYGQGRTVDQCRIADVPGRFAQPDKAQVTWCLPQDSGHVRLCALDVNIMPYTANDLTTVDLIARELNINWGGTWRVRDLCHFEFDKPYQPRR